MFSSEVDSGTVATKPSLASRSVSIDLLPKLRSSRIPALDGMRALAVFLVILYHFSFDWAPASLGVLGFFVLSGFLITWLLLKENDKTGTISLSGFYKRRSLRIFPAFYVYCGGWLLLLLLTGHKVVWADVISAFCYISNYYQAFFHPADSFVTHTWSLAIEEQFYLLWPLCFYFGRHNLKRLAWYLVGLIGFVWIYRVALCLIFHVDQAYIYRAFDTRIDNLMVGCLVAVLVKQGALQRLWGMLSANVYLPLLTVALLAGSSYFTINSFLYRDLVSFAFEPLLVAVLMIQLIVHSQTRAWGWFEARPMRYLGQISYSLYLYHPAVGYQVFKRLPNVPFWESFGIAVAMTVAVASASYYFIEKPFLRLKDRTVFKRAGLKSIAAATAD